MNDDAAPLDRRHGARRAMLAVVAVALALQVVVAGAMALRPRPEPYGWQMYSAVPYIPDAWAVSGETEEPIDVAGLLVHPRAEIDFVTVVRDHGCEQTGADSVRIELADGTLDEVACR